MIENNDDDKEIKEEKEENNNNCTNNKKEEKSKLEITFINNEQKIELECDSEITVEQLINLYNKKLGNNINNNIFLYNEKLLDIQDKSKIKDVLTNNSLILVNKK